MGGPLFIRSLDLFNLPTGPTLGRPTTQVKAESGTKAARFRQKLDVLPFEREPTESRRPGWGGGLSLNREASRKIGEPIRNGSMRPRSRYGSCCKPLNN